MNRNYYFTEAAVLVVRGLQLFCLSMGKARALQISRFMRDLKKDRDILFQTNQFHIFCERMLKALE